MLNKTTILPTDSKALAQKLLRRLIYDEVHVLFVALGSGGPIETMVERAGKLAGKEGEPRWVAWARKPEMIQDVVAELKGDAKLLKQISGARAFTLALTDEVRDVITADEAEPDLVRIEDAYFSAEEKGGA